MSDYENETQHVAALVGFGLVILWASVLYWIITSLGKAISGGPYDAVYAVAIFFTIVTMSVPIVLLVGRDEKKRKNEHWQADERDYDGEECEDHSDPRDHEPYEDDDEYDPDEGRY